jgi:hypothetical protein
MARFVLWPEPGDDSQLLGAGFGTTGTFVLWGEPGDDSQLLFVNGPAASTTDEEDLIEALTASDTIDTEPANDWGYEFDEGEDNINLQDTIDVEEVGAPTELLTEALQVADFLDEHETVFSEALIEDLEIDELLTDVYGDAALAEEAAISDLFDTQSDMYEELAEQAIFIVVNFGEEPTVEAWIVNLKTNGISRYIWPEFNSFAFVNGKYYGALEDGIYEIGGDTDAGADIDMFATDGKRQLGSIQKKRVFAVYLDAETDGQVKLQVYADGQVYTYDFEVPPRNISGGQHETLRASPGRGLRARNWIFEIQNVDGSDLDMSEMHIYPIVLDRRVR